MIIDSSAIVAILFQEPEARFFSEALRDAQRKQMSAASFLEASVVVDAGRAATVGRRFDKLMTEAGIVIAAVTEEQARIARQAYREFGKGSGHPAGLNFGDCFAYALASVEREPLLCLGNDFAQTDIDTVRPS